MQQLLKQQTVTVAKPLMDATQEYVLSGDFMLPEYCPDVAVVLKCVVSPRIHSRRFSGDTLMLDGTAVVRVLYLDEERRCVRAAEFTQPMNCSMRGESGCEGIPVELEILTDYVNCRAVSPRRIEVRGAFTLHAWAVGSQALELPCTAEDARLHVRRVKTPLSVPLAGAEKTAAVSELLSFDSALPPAELLLGGDCTAAVTDCKLLTDKAIVKGQVYLHHLYTDDSTSGTTYVMDYTVPFSVIMDVEGARDGLPHIGHVSILSDTEECVAGMNGANTALDFSAKLLVQLWVYDTEETELLLDAYHCDCPVKLSTRPLSLRSLCGGFRQPATVQKSLSLPTTNLKEIMDVWVTPQPAVGMAQDGRIELTAPLLVSMLVREVDGTVAYYERAEDVRLDCTQPIAYTADEVEAKLTVSGVNYAAVGDALDLRMTVTAAVTLWNTVQESVVSEIALQAEQAYTEEMPALRLYYADPGERVWNIARRCRVSPEGIWEENRLHEDVVTAKTVLLVPAE